MIKIKLKEKEFPYIGIYFKIAQRYYKIHAIDKNNKYLHMYGDSYNLTQVNEHFGTTIERWESQVKRNNYIIVSESEVPERILNYKLKNHEVYD